jgi:hypothetical protein
MARHGIVTGPGYARKDVAIDPFRGGKPSPPSGRTSFMPDALHHPDRLSGHHGK